MSRWVSSRANQIEERYNHEHGEGGKFAAGGEDTSKSIPKTIEQVAAAHPDFKVAKTENGFVAIQKGTGLQAIGKTPGILHENILKLLGDIALEGLAKIVVEGITGGGG